MVKVVKIDPDYSVVKRMVCHNCGSTLEYTPSDVQLLDFADYTGSDWQRGITCPQCQTDLLV